MLDERARKAAHNNALWCHAVCSAHDRPGELLDGIWVNRREVPLFYPNAVTFSEPRDAPSHLERIHALVEAGIPGSWAVKDSFCSLELQPLGFHVLFEAAWFYRSTVPPAHGRATATQPRWDRIREPSELARWETAWRGEASSEPRSPPARIFPPALLADQTIAVLAAYRDRQIVAGAIVNRTGDVAGLSNVFVRESDPDPDRCWAGCVTAAMDVFPGLPLVGYQAEPRLARMRELGFEILRPLRVWMTRPRG